VIAGSGYFRSLHCDSCHNLIVGTPKPGPTLGLTGIHHPRDWVLGHFNEESHAGGDGHDSSSLSMPQRNALVIFVASVKPEFLQTLSAISPEFSDGAQAFVANACASCHRVNGIGGDIGPPLNGLANRRSEAWVRAHFASPRKLSPGSIMPPYHLAQKEERDLIIYLFSLSQ
jgi:cytochrome c2